MKYQILSILLPSLLFTGTVSSNTESNICPFDGFYTGLGIGESITVGHVEAFRQTNISFPAGLNIEGKTALTSFIKKTSFTGNIFAGYGINWDPGYMGIEAFGRAFRGRTKTYETAVLTGSIPELFNLTGGMRTETIAKLRSGEYGFDIRPGVLITPESMLYGRVGAALNRFTFTSLNRSTLRDTGLAQAFDHDRNKRIAALRLGAGLEQYFCACWTVRADYIYTNYRKIEVNRTGTVRFLNPLTGLATATLSNVSNAKIANHTVTLGVAYHW